MAGASSNRRGFSPTLPPNSRKRSGEQPEGETSTSSLEEEVMHAEMCPCPKCRREREMAFESESFEFAGAGETELGSLLSEAEEVELAMELIAVSSEAEMEQFLGKVFGKV